MSSGTSKQAGSGGRASERDNDRRDRLAKELRSNLRKRKALAKVRAAHEQPDDAGKDDDPSA